MSTYLYEKIAQDLRSKIQRKELNDGDRVPTERALARTWKVTTVTVARAMKQLVSDGLIVRLRGRGTFVRAGRASGGAARAPGDKPFRRIGMVYSWHVSSGYYQNALLRGISDALSPADGVFILPYSGFGNYGELVDSEGLDGLVLLAPPEHKRDEIAALRERGLPFVIIGSTWEDEPSWPSVDSDGRAMGRMAAEHLIECGYKEVGVVVCSTQLSNNRLRLESFLDRVGTAGIRIRPEWLLIEPEQTDQARAVRAMLSAEKRPRAVFTGSYLLSEMVAGAAADLKLRIPVDVGIVGCDSDNEGLVLNRIPLTTVVQPLAQIGKQGMTTLLRQMSGDATNAGPAVLPVSLVRGVTTLAAAGSRRSARR